MSHQAGGLGEAQAPFNKAIPHLGPSDDFSMDFNRFQKTTKLPFVAIVGSQPV
jgi:hypothetical protein